MPGYIFGMTSTLIFSDCHFSEAITEARLKPQLAHGSPASAPSLASSRKRAMRDGVPANEDDALL